MFNQQEITIQPGQLITGRRQLKKETRLTEQSIRTALQTLSNIGFLTIKSTNRFSIITICNYDIYQSNENETNQQTNQQVTSRQPTVNQPTTTSKALKKVKALKNEKNISIQHFEEIWLKYPKRDGKKEALRHFLASVLTDQDWQDINKALGNYLASRRVKEGFIKNGSTWFNNWRDWINYKEEVPVIISPEKQKLLDSLDKELGG